MVRHPIKYKWLLMSILEIKKEEYREIKPYWEKRYRKELGDEEMDRVLKGGVSKEFMGLYHAGYGSKVPQFTTRVRLRVGYGVEEWGAEKGKLYFIAEYIGEKQIENMNARIVKMMNEHYLLISRKCGKERLRKRLEEAIRKSEAIECL